MMAERTCRVCGCTQNQACPGGCHWVENDLCSSCASAVLATAVLSWSLLFRNSKGAGPADVWEGMLHDKNGRPMLARLHESERLIFVWDHLGVEIARLGEEENYIAGHYTETELIETFKQAYAAQDGTLMQQDEAA